MSRRISKLLSGCPRNFGLKRMGNLIRSEEFIHKLMPGSSYGAPVGLAVYCVVLGEMDKAADWMEKAIEQRHPLVFTLLPLIRSSPRWSAVAKLMNLSEEARSR